MCADHTKVAHFYMVEQGSPHADEGIIANGRAMNDGPVTDDNFLTDKDRRARIFMNDTTVLDIGAPANGYCIAVSPYYGIKPDRNIFTQGYIPDNYCTRSNENVVFFLY